ncbi:DUF5060 domain-containing protein [Novipirellula artificiosorum]|uniref:DUF5060 domain-containing protein n=1 Tax=Novipirellula artificiosorum TaxID=2528016 RepID=A0A5C6E2B2_9BACT|nr:DUF5060 domain-containing protein [Novipirellula artificiosorum]TWU42117.1 hypothetical protein Poly41_04130 [Novipirellula artificiosorum]
MYSTASKRVLGLIALVLIGSVVQPPDSIGAEATVSGKLAKWHKVTLTFTGPETDERATPNPFTDYRLDVAFTGPSGQKYVVPGFFAADGNAAISGADSGSQWQVHFSADESGPWSYQATFLQGAGVALADQPVGESGGFMDGVKGTFQIGPADGPGNGLYSKGRLQYVGERYQRFAETGEIFLKVGADAPENLLAYDDFDATPNVGKRRKSWSPHLKDYNTDADGLLWGPNRDKGKGLLGAINYLSGKGMNVFSFLTFNVAGDDENIFMHLVKKDLADYEANHGKKTPDKAWTTSIERLRMDVSKTAQWDRVLQYGDQKGMFLHFKTSEAENCKLMDNGDLGPERRLYFRELVARFGYHLALNWNFGEENTQSTEQHQAQNAYVKRIDPYNHLRVLHTFPGAKDSVYGPLLGDKSELTGLSLQTSNPAFTQVYGDVKKWVLQSQAAGKPWVVACDEPGDATHALVTDEEDPGHDNARINGLWGTFMAGGCGTEWYFGYKHPHSDLTCEDWRSRDLFWDQCKIALDFLTGNDIPLSKMQPTLTRSGDWALAGDGCVVVFVKQGGKTQLDLPQAKFSVTKLIAKTGETESLGTIDGKPLTTLQASVKQDVVMLLKTKQRDLKYDLGMPEAPEKVNLEGATVFSAIEDFNLGPFDGFVPNYVDKARKAIAINAAQFPGKKSAAEMQYEGNPGEFDIALMTMTETDGESTYELYVNDKKVGQIQNPVAREDYEKVVKVFPNVTLQAGNKIRIVFDAASNKKIAEDDGFAFSRGRWTGIAIAEPGKLKDATPAAKESTPSIPEFAFNYDPTNARKVHQQTDGILVVEAEDYDAVDREVARKWYRTTIDSTPGITPDPDPNHAAGAVGGAYLELLPDTRVTHADRLVNGVSFTNVPGQCSVLYYPVIFTEPGRYYVWARICCTGSEDNGLHVGIDGQWPESGARMQFTGQHGLWQWDSRQRTTKVHTGVLGQIWLDVEEPGLHTIMFSMREDGFELDRFLLTKQPKAMESKNLDKGPDASPLAK